MTTHATAHELSLWIDDELPRPRAREVELHVKECDVCREHYLSTLQLIEGLRGMERVAPPSTLGLVVEQHRLQIGNPKLRQRLERPWKRWPDPMLLTYLGVVLALGFMIVMVTRISDRPPSGTRIYAPFEVAPSTGASESTHGVVDADLVWVEPGVTADEAANAIIANREQTARVLARVGAGVPRGTHAVIARANGTVVRFEVRDAGRPVQAAPSSGE